MFSEWNVQMKLDQFFFFFFGQRGRAQLCPLSSRMGGKTDPSWQQECQLSLCNARLHFYSVLIDTGIMHVHTHRAYMCTHTLWMCDNSSDTFLSPTLTLFVGTLWCLTVTFSAFKQVSYNKKKEGGARWSGGRAVNMVVLPFVSSLPVLSTHLTCFSPHQLHIPWD